MKASGATEAEVEAGAEALAAEARRRLGPPPELERWPLVSIVVVNRDGASHLRRLLAGLAERTDYPALELIVVDNASSDDSVNFARTAEAPFPISILANPHNESFSDACNQGAGPARGELLLFLNNDVEPFEPGWLRELVACQLRGRSAVAGATLLYPTDDSPSGYRVQHRAIRLVAEEGGMLGPNRRSYGAEPFGEGFGEEADSPVAVGACILITRELFDRVSGFTHGFIYGGEDIDLGLKVLAEGGTVVCSGRSLLIHRLGSTRTKEEAERQLALARGNRRLFWERWGPRLRREYELDRLAGGGFWTEQKVEPGEGLSREKVLAPGFCLKASEPDGTHTTDELLNGLGTELRRRGRRCAVLRDRETEGLRALDHDIAVHLHGPARYIPRTGQLNVLWVVSHFDTVTAIECRRYDLVLTACHELGRQLRDSGLVPPVLGFDTTSPKPDEIAERLLAAVEARIRQLGFPLRIGSPRVQ